MQIYVVTSEAKDESTAGVILEVKVRIWGVFTELTRANDVATKYEGTVQAVYLDKEESGAIIQNWINPGYAD